MAKIDKVKEYISILKVYMGLLIALIISAVAGTSKLFNSNLFDVTFWLGILSTIILSITFLKLAKYTHKKIDELEDII
jgi:uncharacterized protein YacL